MRVLIAEGLEPVRARLAGMVCELPSVRLLGANADLEATVESIRREHPDLLIVGSRLSDGTGFEVLRHVADAVPSMWVIMLCHQLDSEYLYSGHTMGAHFVLESPRDIDLVPSLITKLSGDRRRHYEEHGHGH